jgi:hypothetical protein
MLPYIIVAFTFMVGALLRMLYHIHKLEDCVKGNAARFDMLVDCMKKYHYALYKKKEANSSYSYQKRKSVTIGEKLEAERSYHIAKREFSQKIICL